MHYSSAVALSALFFSAFFQSNVAANQQLGDMEPLYIFTPGPAPGNCDKNKPDLLTAFGESIDMLTRSTAAIIYVNQPMPGFLHPLNRRKWKAWAQLMKEVYNIDVEPKTGLQLPSGPAQGILDNFNTILNAHNYISPDSGPYKYWFFCDDDYLKYKPPPTAEEAKVWDWPPGIDGTAFRKQVEANGYWNATGGTVAHSLPKTVIAARPGDVNKKSYLCSGSDAHAFVVRLVALNKVLTFCPAAFNGILYPTAAKAMQNKSFKKAGANLQDLQTYGTNMIHEWGHLVLDFIDEKAVDYNGNELSTPDNLVLIYSWGRVTQTAIYYPDRVRKTPDAYTMFAMAVYYTEVNNWGLQYVTGRGQYYI